MEDLFTGNKSIHDFEQMSDDVLQIFPVGKASFAGVQAARNEFKSLILENNFDFSKIKEALRCKGGDLERIENFIDKITKKEVLLLYAVLIEHNTPYGECVNEFDWVLKLITGTEVLKSARKPIVQLQLTTVDASGIERKNVYDIQKDTLSNLITVLDNVCL